MLGVPPSPLLVDSELIDFNSVVVLRVCFHSGILHAVPERGLGQEARDRTGIPHGGTGDARFRRGHPGTFNASSPATTAATARELLDEAAAQQQHHEQHQQQQPRWIRQRELRAPAHSIPELAERTG